MPDLIKITEDYRQTAKARAVPHQAAKLTAWDVWSMRVLMDDDEYSGRELAVLYGVSPTAVSRIRRGHTWA